MMNRRNLLVSILAASLCCGGCSLPPPETVPSTLGTAPETSPSTPGQTSFLYVGGGKLSKYNLGSSTPLRSVMLAYSAFAIALDRLGHVFVLENYGSCGGQVQVFSARYLRLLRTITAPVCLSGGAIDRQGYFYFTTCCQGLWVYAPGGTKPLRKFSRGHGDSAGLAVDASDNLYVANGRDVDVYAPGATKLLYRIGEGNYGAQVLAIASQ